MIRSRILVLVVLLIVLFPAAGSPAARTKAGKGTSPLQMEDLEVRGYREKPEALYLPVPQGGLDPSPVRYDLFLRDMSRPIAPGETEPAIPPSGGNSD